MPVKELFLTGNERTFSDSKIIVSKTDQRGVITYANDVFLKISGYTEAEVLGKPHSIIRHPEMPRSIFKLLWDTITNGKEIFAYVNNRAKNGDNYWVFAHVTPTFDAAQRIVGYHSNRRVPKPSALAVIKPLYQQLHDIEQGAANTKAGMGEAYNALLKTVSEKGMAYDELMFTI